jgi:hypothetical protein
VGNEDKYRADYGKTRKKGSGTEWFEVMNWFEACCEDTGIPGGTGKKTVVVLKDTRGPVIELKKFAGCCDR